METQGNKDLYTWKGSEYGSHAFLISNLTPPSEPGGNNSKMKDLVVQQIPLDALENYSGVKAIITVGKSDKDEEIIDKLSKTLLRDVSTAAQRWMNHLPEYDVRIERLTGTYVTTATLYVEREIEEDILLDVNIKTCDIDPDTMNFVISDEEVIHYMSNSDFYSDECNDDVCHCTGILISSKRASSVPLCEECSGTGMKECYACNGSGEETCSSCDGTGEGRTHKDIVGTETYYENGVLKERPRYSVRVSQCSHCYGRGYVVCSVCHGQKHFPCEDCQGTGRMKGANIAYNRKFLHETHKLYKDSKILFGKDDYLTIPFFSLIPVDEKDVMTIYHNIDEGRPQDFKITSRDRQLMDDVNNYCLHYVSEDYLTDNQYYVGVAVRACEVPSVLRITVKNKKSSTVMYLVDKYLIFDDCIPEVSFLKGIFNSLSRNRRGK